jgi:protein SCO1/2
LRATKGKLTYLYFGYTHCPDACPLTMSDIAAAFHREPVSVRHRVDVVFVTVDPRRDTPHVLRRWLDHFDRSFIGLTGSAAQIAAAERAAGVPLAAAEKTKGGYSVAHSTLVIPYSPDGRAHVVYSAGFRSRDYAHDMPLLLRFRS